MATEKLRASEGTTNEQPNLAEQATESMFGPMGLPGMAKPMTACPRSPLRLRALTGMDPASLA